MEKLTQQLLDIYYQMRKEKHPLADSIFELANDFDARITILTTINKQLQNELDSK